MSDEYEYLKGRYVGGALFVCERCGRETINIPCACDKRGMVATITTTGSGATTWTVPTTACPKCGRPRIQVGSGEGLCTCPVEIPSVFGQRKIGLHPGNAKTAPGFDDAWDLGPARAAWECPRCHAINAPHVDRCDCKEGA